MTDELLTHEEAAAYLRRAPKTLYDMNYRGSGPTRIRAGGKVLYRRADLDSWLKANEIAAGRSSR